MSEVLYQDRAFNISRAVLDDVVGIGEAHLQSWLETYPNEEFGVTEDWIKEEFSYLVKDGVAPSGRDNGNTFRRKAIENLNDDTLYEVVKDEKGVVQGFMHVDKKDGVVNLNAIYLTNDLKGTGVAYKLMDQALGFAEELPIKLQVAAYNERAIKFYEKYGFKKGEVEEELFHGKIPIMNMSREAKKAITYSNLNPNLEIKESPVEGKGIFTKVPIKKGEKLTINIDPQPVEVHEFNDEDFAKFREDCIQKGLQWDSVSLGTGRHKAAISERDKNPENYGNHSCDPNLSSDHIALRDIEPGEELTVDYAELSDVNWSMECKCGSKNCKGIVKGKVE